MARDAGTTVISHESIYRFIYAQIARKNDYSWRHYLPRAKAKRGWRGAKEEAPPPSSPTESLWPTGPRRWSTARPRATGRRT